MFTPASLFASGEQGAWYDPSDLSTLFQDSAGTTPVTAVEQPVGLILDKSGNGNHASQVTAASRPVLSARKNKLLATETLATQNVTVTASPNVLSFTGTGTITLTGASTAGPLVGTGASDRVWVEFTPTAGTLTLTVSGSVTKAQLEDGGAVGTYQRVTTDYDYDTVGFPHYWKLDGVDDYGRVGPFAAGTLTASMDVLVLMRRNSGAGFCLLAQDDNSVVYGVAQDGNTYRVIQDGAYINARTWVNGVELIGGADVTADQLHDAMPVGEWHVVEFHNVKMDTLTNLRIGGAGTGLPLNGAIAEIILAPAQSAEERTQAREYLAAQAGITLP